MGTRNYISTMVFEEEENGNIQPDVIHMLEEETTNNVHLREENKSLSRELGKADDEIHLLHQQLSVKSHSLRLLYEELDLHDGMDESDMSAVARDVLSNLQQKIKDLEQEKIHLRLKLDDNRQRMVEQEDINDRTTRDHQRQADDAHSMIHHLEREITQLTDENTDQAQETGAILGRLNNLERDLFQLELRNQRLSTEIDTSQFENRELRLELDQNRLVLHDLQRTYNETRHELTLFRFKQSPSPHRPRTYSDSLSFHPDSLARELEDTVIDEAGSMSPFRGIARSFSHSEADFRRYQRASRDDTRSFGNATSALQTARAIAVARARALKAHDNVENHAHVHKSHDHHTHAHYFTDDSGYDQEADVETVPLLTEEEDEEDESADDVVFSTSLPDPILSEKIQARSKYPAFYRMVEIIKPLDGSYMLGKWKELAYPNFTSFLDEREGVTSQFESHQDMRDILGKLDRSWSDCEEDDDPDFVSDASSSSTLSSLDEGEDDSGVDTSLTNNRLLSKAIPGSGNSLDKEKSMSSKDENVTSSSSTPSSLAEKIKKLGIQAATARPSTSLPLQSNIVTTLAPHIFSPVPDAATRGIEYILEHHVTNLDNFWTLSSDNWVHKQHPLLTSTNLTMNLGVSDVVRSCLRNITRWSSKTDDKSHEDLSEMLNIVSRSYTNNISSQGLLTNAIKFHLPTSGRLKDGSSSPDNSSTTTYHDFSILEKLSLLRNNDEDLSPWKFETRNNSANSNPAPTLPDESSLFDDSENHFRPMFDISVY